MNNTVLDIVQFAIHAKFIKTVRFLKAAYVFVKEDFREALAHSDTSQLISFDRGEEEEEGK